MTCCTIKRAVPLATLVALAAGSAPGASAGTAGTAPLTTTASARVAHGASTHGPPSAARLLSCRRSLRLEGRVAAVAASMRPIAGAKRLELRIDLAQRPLAGGHWMLRTDVPGLGAWVSPSDPAIGTRPGDVFRYHQAVARLVVGYAYRFRAGFRWRDASGAVVREATSTTQPCREPDLRPDLVLPRARAVPAPRGKGLVRYVVSVRDDGRTSARGIVVSAAFAGAAGPAPSRVLGRLRSRQVATVSFVGPACAVGLAPPVFSVDPGGAIDESDESNNVLAFDCPAPARP